MKQKNLPILLACLVVMAAGSCTAPTAPTACSTPCKSIEARKVLILGNSITQHGPLPSEGWLGNWGMAASAAEKDFVHVTTEKLKSNCPCVEGEVKAVNIAFWERDFDFDFSTEAVTRDLPSFQPDILIIRLGENVQDDYLKSHDYGKALQELVATFSGSKTHVLVTGNFWPHPYKDSVQQAFAVGAGFEFVPLVSLASSGSNRARDTYKGGVGEHPSDKGMAGIATLIVERINAKKWYEPASN